MAMRRRSSKTMGSGSDDVGNLSEGSLPMKSLKRPHIRAFDPTDWDPLSDDEKAAKYDELGRSLEALLGLAPFSLSRSEGESGGLVTMSPHPLLAGAAKGHVFLRLLAFVHPSFLSDGLLLPSQLVGKPSLLSFYFRTRISWLGFEPRRSRSTRLPITSFE